MDNYIFKYMVSNSRYVDEKEATRGLEIFSYSDPKHNCVKEEALDAENFEDFLYQKGAFTPRVLPSGIAQVAAIRLVLQLNAEHPETFAPGTLSLEAPSYLSMIEAFNLPYRAIEGLSALGLFFWAGFSKDKTNPRLQTIYRKADVMKKGKECGWELILSHDSKSGTTAGFCKGTPDTDMVKCIDHLKGSIPDICHPMTFNMIIFTNGMSRKTFTKQRECRDWLRRIEHAISLRGQLDTDTDTGYRDESGMVDFELVSRQLAECHSQLLWKNPKGHIEILDGFAEAMKKFKGSLRLQLEMDEVLRVHEDIILRSDFHKKQLQSLDNYKDTTLKRIEIQKSALSIACSQLENRVNFQIATSQQKLANASKRDAAAQKTLGILGAFFLPGAFISSVFSMTFFNWQAHDTDSGSSVSPMFWIYWVVSVPLTLVVVGWFYLLERSWVKRIDDEDARVEKEMNLIKYNVQSNMRHKEVRKFDPKDGIAFQKWASG